MKGFAIALVISVLALCTLAAYAATATIQPRYRPAHVRCAAWAEDSAAHLRLVKFENGVAYYRCRTKGY